MLERGHILRGGTRLHGARRLVLEILAAPEAVSEVRGDDPLRADPGGLSTWATGTWRCRSGRTGCATWQTTCWTTWCAAWVMQPIIRTRLPFEPESGAYAARPPVTAAPIQSLRRPAPPLQPRCTGPLVPAAASCSWRAPRSPVGSYAYSEGLEYAVGPVRWTTSLGDGLDPRPG